MLTLTMQMQALLAGPRRHQTAPTPRQDRPLKKYRFLIKNVGFSLEKCLFGAHRGVLHYILRRKRVMLANNGNFELEICVKARGGRAAPVVGDVSVAQMVAVVTPRAPATPPELDVYTGPSFCLSRV